MRSGRRDVRVALLVREALARDETIAGQSVAVEVQNGVVILTGTVDSRTTRREVGDTARCMNEVIDVCNVLRVSAPSDRPVGPSPTSSTPHPSDDELFQDIVIRATTTPADFSLNPRSRLLTVAMAMALWTALTLLIVWLAWPGVLIAVGLAAVIPYVLRRRAGRYRDRR